MSMKQRKQKVRAHHGPCSRQWWSSKHSRYPWKPKVIHCIRPFSSPYIYTTTLSGCEWSWLPHESCHKNDKIMESTDFRWGKYTYFQCYQTVCRKVPPWEYHLSSQGHAIPKTYHCQHALARRWMLELHQINTSFVKPSAANRWLSTKTRKM